MNRPEQSGRTGMDTSVILLFVTFGVMGGFIAGFLGVGGGVLFVPCLYHGFIWMGIEDTGLAMHLAVGTSLAIIVITSLSSALGHAIHGALTGGQVLSMAIMAVPAALAGAAIASVVGGDFLKSFFGAFLLFVAYRFIKPLPKSDLDPDRIIPIPQLMMVGGISGLLSSLLGIGGGIITVSLLHLTLRVPIHRAVANSSGLIVFSSIAGMIGNVIAGWGVEGLPVYSYGYVNLVVWSIMAFIAAIFAQVGAWSASKTHPDSLKKPFAIILLLVGLKMLYPF
ncbi:MAG: sulfite exporter TauE/SafE family protein [Candidatus Omnitrophica bacterium]|nr:sulfite exporter TauE/SafE family protein [Candidatus Omnitrophota bacterium]